MRFIPSDRELGVGLRTPEEALQVEKTKSYSNYSHTKELLVTVILQIIHLENSHLTLIHNVTIIHLQTPREI